MLAISLIAGTAYADSYTVWSEDGKTTCSITCPEPHDKEGLHPDAFCTNDTVDGVDFRCIFEY